MFLGGISSANAQKNRQNRSSFKSFWTGLNTKERENHGWQSFCESPMDRICHRLLFRGFGIQRPSWRLDTSDVLPLVKRCLGTKRFRHLVYNAPDSPLSLVTPHGGHMCKLKTTSSGRVCTCGRIHFSWYNALITITYFEICDNTTVDFVVSNSSNSTYVFRVGTVASLNIANGSTFQLNSVEDGTSVSLENCGTVFVT